MESSYRQLITRMIDLSRVSVAALLSVVLAGMLPQVASAHTTTTVAPESLLRFWSPDPVVIVGVLVAAALYLRGSGSLREIGKRGGRGAIISSGRIAAFWCGLGTMAIALASPLDTATATMFTAHMIQHVLLIAVGPPLILIGKPMTVMMIGLPRSWRRPIATITHRIPPIAVIIGILTTPIVAFLVHAGTLWIWHDPGLYQAAVRHEWIHAIEHGTFVVTAFFYWWAIIPVGGHARHTVGPAVGILSVFGMGMQGAALGAILTFWGSVIYPVYDGRSELWGLSPLSDQRLAGLIMWIPAGSVYVAIAMMLLVTWFRQDQDELPPPPLEAAPSTFPAGTTKHGQTALG